MVYNLITLLPAFPPENFEIEKADRVSCQENNPGESMFADRAHNCFPGIGNL